MKNLKECGVVMLATTQETNLFIASDKQISYHKPQQGLSIIPIECTCIGTVEKCNCDKQCKE